MKKTKNVKTVEQSEAAGVVSTRIAIGGGSLSELNSHFESLVEPPLGFTKAIERALNLSHLGYITYSQFWMNARFLDLESAVLRPFFEKYMSFLESHGRAEKLESIDPTDPLWLVR